jgi:hypothetical protein
LTDAEFLKALPVRRFRLGCGRADTRVEVSLLSGGSYSDPESEAPRLRLRAMITGENIVTGMGDYASGVAV